MFRERSRQLLLNFSQLKEYSLANGILGASLLNLELFLQTNESFYLEKSQNHLKKSFKLLSLRPIFVPSLFGGVLGFFWLGKKKALLESSKPILQSLEQSLENQVKSFLTIQGRWELVSGAIGIAISLPFDHILQEHIHNYILNELTSYKWPRSPLNTEQILSKNFEMSDRVNTGIAHGISGALLYLSYYLECCECEKTRKALLKNYELILSISKELSAKSIPSFYPDNVPPRRNTWCYGDMGIAFALKVAGKTLGRKGDMNMIQNRYEKGKMAFLNESDDEGGLCHGRASFDLLNQFFYNDNVSTQNSRSLTSTNPGFIMGDIGLALSQLSIPSLSNWESLLLLRNPWVVNEEK